LSSMISIVQDFQSNSGPPGKIGIIRERAPERPAATSAAGHRDDAATFASLLLARQA
jgi:hypothetical protein